MFLLGQGDKFVTKPSEFVIFSSNQGQIRSCRHPRHVARVLSARPSIKYTKLKSKLRLTDVQAKCLEDTCPGVKNCVMLLFRKKKNLFERPELLQLLLALSKQTWRIENLVYYIIAKINSIVHRVIRRWVNDSLRKLS